MAALAVGASPMTVPPDDRQACDRAAMAVVFPVPAGASARASRWPLVAISVTRAAWPALRVLPRAADSARASSMSSAPARRPPTRVAAARMRRSAATVCAQVYCCVPCREYTEAPSRRRRTAGSARSASTLLACGSDSGWLSAASVIAAARSASPAWPVARTNRWASANTWWRCQVERLVATTSITAPA